MHSNAFFRISLDTKYDTRKAGKIFRIILLLDKWWVQLPLQWIRKIISTTCDFQCSKIWTHAKNWSEGKSFISWKCMKNAFFIIILHLLLFHTFTSTLTTAIVHNKFFICCEALKKIKSQGLMEVSFVNAHVFHFWQMASN